MMFSLPYNIDYVFSSALLASCTKAMTEGFSLLEELLYMNLSDSHFENLKNDPRSTAKIIQLAADEEDKTSYFFQGSFVPISVNAENTRYITSRPALIIKITTSLFIGKVAKLLGNLN